MADLSEVMAKDLADYYRMVREQRADPLSTNSFGDGRSRTEIASATCCFT